MKPITALATLTSVLALASCGKEEAPKAKAVAEVSATEITCSYAPSQSTVVAHLAGAGGGSAAATAALAQALGLSVVTHGSGGLILSGASGYIAGTLGTAVAAPVVIGVGVVVAGSAGVIELICAPLNHPEMAAKVKEAADEFASRTKQAVPENAEKVGEFVAEQRVKLIKSGDEAFAYAYRKSVEISEALKR